MNIAQVLDASNPRENTVVEIRSVDVVPVVLGFTYKQNGATKTRIIGKGYSARSHSKTKGSIVNDPEKGLVVCNNVRTGWREYLCVPLLESSPIIDPYDEILKRAWNTFEILPAGERVEPGKILDRALHRLESTRILPILAGSGLTSMDAAREILDGTPSHQSLTISTESLMKCKSLEPVVNFIYEISTGGHRSDLLTAADAAANRSSIIERSYSPDSIAAKGLFLDTTLLHGFSVPDALMREFERIDISHNLLALERLASAFSEMLPAEEIFTIAKEVGITVNPDADPALVVSELSRTLAMARFGSNLKKLRALCKANPTSPEIVPLMEALKEFTHFPEGDTCKWTNVLFPDKGFNFLKDVTPKGRVKRLEKNLSRQGFKIPGIMSGNNSPGPGIRTDRGYLINDLVKGITDTGLEVVQLEYLPEYNTDYLTEDKKRFYPIDREGDNGYLFVESFYNEPTTLSTTFVRNIAKNTFNHIDIDGSRIEFKRPTIPKTPRRAAAMLIDAASGMGVSKQYNEHHEIRQFGPALEYDLIDSLKGRLPESFETECDLALNTTITGDVVERYIDQLQIAEDPYDGLNTIKRELVARLMQAPEEQRVEILNSINPDSPHVYPVTAQGIIDAVLATLLA